MLLEGWSFCPWAWGKVPFHCCFWVVLRTSVLLWSLSAICFFSNFWIYSLLPPLHKWKSVVSLYNTLDCIGLTFDLFNNNYSLLSSSLPFLLQENQEPFTLTIPCGQVGVTYPFGYHISHILVQLPIPTNYYCLVTTRKRVFSLFSLWI